MSIKFQFYFIVVVTILWLDIHVGRFSVIFVEISLTGLLIVFFHSESVSCCLLFITSFKKGLLR